MDYLSLVINVNKRFLIRAIVLSVIAVSFKLYGEYRYKAGLHDMAKYVLQLQEESKPTGDAETGDVGSFDHKGT